MPQSKSKPKSKRSLSPAIDPLDKRLEAELPMLVTNPPPAPPVDDLAPSAETPAPSSEASPEEMEEMEHTEKIVTEYKWLDIFLGVVVVGLLVYLLFIIFYHSAPAKTVLAPIVVVTTTPPMMSALDGSFVTSTAAEYPPVVAVMIDNHPDARPQSGLDQASVVYEAPVEGGLTRYMAIFKADSTVPKVGPVRSARPYFLDWLREYGDIPYLHAGGSPEALTLINQENIWDANQFYFGQYYWRATDRTAPHNLYTNGQDWQAFEAKYGANQTTTAWSGWTFSNTVAATTSVTGVSFSYAPGYEVSWNYNPDQKLYERFVSSTPYLVDDGATITASNVIVQEMGVQVIDSDGRLQLATTGGGAARIFRAGTMVIGTWQKNLPTDRTRFYDENDQEVTLLPGQTWIQVVPTTTALTITN